MARSSFEKLKDAMGNLMTEQERDRDSLSALLSHARKMLDTLQSIHEQEDQRIDDDAAERKSDIRRLFSQLKSAENERIALLERQLQDLEGLIDVDDQAAKKDTAKADAEVAVCKPARHLKQVSN